MHDANPLQPGQRVGNGRFVLVRALGRGGMGEVWLAQDQRLGEPVALKFLPPEVRADTSALDDLRRETAKSHKLTHPNIVRIHDFHEPEGEAAFISMEYVEGWTLTAVRVEQPSRVLSWEYLRPLVQQLCAALDYAHGERVIHRDLKPGNVMVDSRGRLKLADFGIAATVSDSVSRVSNRHATSGTLPYMSPQQLAGKRPSAADDIYALGATLYELLTSKPPFYTGDITHQVLHEPPEPLGDRLAGLEVANVFPADVAAIVMACLAKDAAQRPQSARAVAEWIGLDVSSRPSTESLAREVFSEPSDNPPSALEQTPVASAGPRWKLVLAGGVFVLLFLLAVAAGYWLRRPSIHAAPANQRSDRGSPSPAEAAPAGAESLAANSHSADASNESRALDQIPPAANSDAVEPGFISLFNGHDLTGWDGDPRFWSVRDGAIKGQSYDGRTPERGNTYLIWKGGVVSDFEVRFSYKLVKGETGSGVLYRGRDMGDWHAQGYHADFWPAANDARRFSGALAYEAPGGGGRPGFGSLALPGEKVVWGADGKKRLVGHTEKTAAEIQAAIREGDWNDYVVVARGGHIIHEINGMVTVEVTDNDVQRRFLSGILGLKMRANKGQPMLVYFKDIRLKRLGNGALSDGKVATGALLWVPLFDGRTLSGWTAIPRVAGQRAEWSVGADGSITGQGPVSHLVSSGTYANLEFKAEAKLTHAGNSGMLFRVNPHPNRPNGYPEGYEAQIENTGGDPQKTGSLYNLHKVTEQLVQDDNWCTQHIIAIGNRIIIKVNGRTVTDFVDWRNTYQSGRLALQQNHPGAVVCFRNLAVKSLPTDDNLAWAEAKKDMPDLGR